MDDNQPLSARESSESTVLTPWLTTPAVLGLAACGGGSDLNSLVGGNASSASSQSAGQIPDGAINAASTSTKTSVERDGVLICPNDVGAARFLLQAQFSASDAEIAELKRIGLSAWLDQQFNLPMSQTAWDWLISKGYNDSAKDKAEAADYMMWNQLITSADTLRKRVALALSEIFVVSTNGVNIQSVAFAMAAYWDLLVEHAFGNYRTLLEAITLNPAMGVYLNTKGNVKENTLKGKQPDENYGREVMQLFSIGLYELNNNGSYKLDSNGNPIETYDNTTVTNIARAFTGWDFDTTGATSYTNPLQNKTPMKLFPSLHSTLPASFLGVTIPANTDGKTALRITLDTLFKHPNVGPFIGKQLIQRLVTSNPSVEYIGRVASAFNDNGSGVRGDLKAVISAILLDPEATREPGSSNTTFGKLREPMLRFVQWARTFGATSIAGDWLVGDLSNTANRLGQSPLRAPSVFNFFRPAYVPPNTEIATSGYIAPEFQLSNEVSVAGYVNFMQSAIRNSAGLVSQYTGELALVNDLSALVNRLNVLLTAGQLSNTSLDLIISAIGTISAATPTGKQNRVYAAILLVMASSEYLIQK